MPDNNERMQRVAKQLRIKIGKKSKDLNAALTDGRKVDDYINELEGAARTQRYLTEQELKAEFGLDG